MKKTKKIEFRLTVIEHKIIENKAFKSGSTISEFIRNISLGYQLNNKLTQDEIDVYKSLTIYADNFRRISNLFKLGDTTGVKEACLETATKIRIHLNKLR